MVSYERFKRTAEWVVIMAPVMVEAVPAGLTQRKTDNLDTEALWRLHLEQKRQASRTMPSGPNPTSPADDEESEDGDDSEDSDSISDGISSNTTEDGPDTTRPPITGTSSTRISGPSSTAITSSSRTMRSGDNTITTPVADMMPTDLPSSTKLPSTILSNGSPVFDMEPTSSFTPTEAAQIGEDADHIKMEFGVSAGVVGAFVVLGIIIFYYLRKKGKGPVWQSLTKPFSSSRSGSAVDPNTANGAAPPMVSLPTAPPPVIVVSERRTSAAPSVASPSPSEIDRFNSLRRKYTISRSMPDGGRQTPAPSYRRDSTSSTRSRESVRSMGTNGLPRGPKLPIIPAAAFNDPFTDDKKDPFADPTPADFPAVPAPLRFPVKSSIKQSLRTSRLESTDEVLTLTDPRVSDSRRLTVANRSVRDSLPSPPANLKKKTLAPEPLRLNPRLPTPSQSRFSWTTKDDNSTPGFRKQRESLATVSTQGPPKHRNVTSWVNHETRRIERHPTEEDPNTPRYAKSERDLYDRRSLNSGMDTRRTEYEYDSDY